MWEYDICLFFWHKFKSNARGERWNNLVRNVRCPAKTDLPNLPTVFVFNNLHSCNPQMCEISWHNPILLYEIVGARASEHHCTICAKEDFVLVGCLKHSSNRFISLYLTVLPVCLASHPHHAFQNFISTPTHVEVQLKICLSLQSEH